MKDAQRTTHRRAGSVAVGNCRLGLAKPQHLCVYSVQRCGFYLLNACRGASQVVM